jgi:adenylate cyclase
MMTQFLNWFANFVSEPDDSEEWRIRKMIGVGAMTAAVFSWLSNSLIYFASNEPTAGLIGLISSALYALAVLTYGIWRNYGARILLLFAVQTIAGILLHIGLGGYSASALVMAWQLAFPMVVLVSYHRTQGIVLYLASILLFIVLAVFEPLYLRESNNLPESVRTGLFVYNALGSSAFMFLTLYYFIWQNQILSQQILREQQKADALLLNILPKEIAAILKDDQRTIADHYENASILFADVVNFTPLSARLTPDELVRLLDEVFSRFDTLTEKYGLEKIKTIGDCYMVASGVPRARPDHAHAIIHLALEMRDYVASHSFSGHQLAFRIGINSGPVTAGVIGRKKFIYDLWGDAVNTASRMETYGESGGIQITEATYALIKDAFVCEPKGTITVKGKGEMHTWRVISAVDW